MCTALTLGSGDHYFGRNLDLDRSYGEEVCIMPHRFPVPFRRMGTWEDHFAVIGMATVVSGMPLFYDGVNEHGLAMAGLNFPGNAYYAPIQPEGENVSPFELIPWILGQCRTVGEARQRLNRINLADIPFSDQLPLAPLHWIIADRTQSIVVESMKDGLHIHDDPPGVLTNNPPFPYQMFNLNQYRNLRIDSGENFFSEELPLEVYCQGLGALGLPGDVSSMSRFVRAAFGRAHSVCGEDESSAVSQFFHLLSSVEMVRGCCRTDGGAWDITVYSACMNLDRGLYYYATYDNRQISCVDLHCADLEGDRIIRFPLITEQQICYQNREQA